jgi:hypothetical protein
MISFAGCRVGGDRCTTEIELDAERRWLWVRLASMARFSVALDVDAVDILAETLTDGSVCAVPCQHKDRGRWLLCASTERLSLDCPDDRIEIVFTPAVITHLVDHIRRCQAAMLP